MKKNKGTSMSNDNNFDLRLNRLEIKEEHIINAFSEIKSSIMSLSLRVDAKFDQVLNKIDLKFESLDKKIDQMNTRLWALNFFIVGGFASILGLIAHIFHWI